MTTEISVGGAVVLVELHGLPGPRIAVHLHAVVRSFYDEPPALPELARFVSDAQGVRKTRRSSTTPLGAPSSPSSNARCRPFDLRIADVHAFLCNAWHLPRQ